MPSLTMIIGAVAGLALLAAAGLGFLLQQAYEANGALRTQLAADDAVIKSHEADAKKNALAVAQLAQKLTDTETRVVTVTEKIYAAPVTRECAQSPAMKAASEGLKTLFAAPAAPALSASGRNAQGDRK